MLALFFFAGFLLRIPCWLFCVCVGGGGEFLLHIPCWLHFYLGRFSYTSHAGCIFIWRVSITYPMFALFFFAEFLLRIPCWLMFVFFSREFLLHIPCWLHFYLGGFSYTSRAGFIFIWGVSLTHPMLASSLFFIWRVSLTHPMLALFFWGEFLLHIPCWLKKEIKKKKKIWGVSLTHPALALFFFFFFFFLSREFFLHIPCLLSLSLGSFSYTSRAGFIFIWGVSLTHPMLALFFMWGVSLTHPMLA